MNALNWEDIFVDASQLNFNQLLLEWPGMTTGQIRPIGASAFGDLFFEIRTGEVQRIDVLEGGVSTAAESFQQFTALMNSQEWQEQNLLTQGVALLKERGVARGPSQFFGFSPHPALAGRIDWSRVIPLDAAVWNSICAQSLGYAPAPEAQPAPIPQPKSAWWKWGRR
ncbi:hypothetical protein [Achromobacter animicus]|uniref:hypothetical protein n=1 Tax=Achromobacter animicus TaxID=1389935 RepID=UPI0028B1E171|nr:hypothetical protein [Achromobacter animicus]